MKTKKEKKAPKNNIGRPAPPGRLVEAEPDVWPGPIKQHIGEFKQLSLQKAWRVTIADISGEEAPRVYLATAPTSKPITDSIPQGWEVEELKFCGYCNVFLPAES